MLPNRPQIHRRADHESVRWVWLDRAPPDVTGALLYLGIGLAFLVALTAYLAGPTAAFVETFMLLGGLFQYRQLSRVDATRVRLDHRTLSIERVVSNMGRSSPGFLLATDARTTERVPLDRLTAVEENGNQIVLRRTGGLSITITRPPNTVSDLAKTIRTAWHALEARAEPRDIAEADRRRLDALVDDPPDNGAEHLAVTRTDAPSGPVWTARAPQAPPPAFRRPPAPAAAALFALLTVLAFVLTNPVPLLAGFALAILYPFLPSGPPPEPAATRVRLDRTGATFETVADLPDDPRPTDGRTTHRATVAWPALDRTERVSGRICLVRTDGTTVTIPALPEATTDEIFDAIAKAHRERGDEQEDQGTAANPSAHRRSARVLDRLRS